METVSDAPEKVDFFISYAGVERAWAEWVTWHLQQHGFSVEFDHWHWKAGDNTTLRMSDALARADRFLALLSPSYFERPRYTRDEWTAAFDDRERGTGGFIPLHVAELEKSEIPDLLRPIKAGILYGKSEKEALTELLSAVGKPAGPQGKPGFPDSAVTIEDRDKAAPRLPASTPKASNVPPRLPLFTGRDEVLDRIRTTFQSRSPVQALHGMGGVGKTQTAAEYCHRFASQYDTVWWLDAEQTVTLDSQLADLAHTLNTVPATMPVADAAQSARQHLRTNGRWLLVFDNAEDPDTFRSLLPEGVGHVLITSRDPGWHSAATPMDIGLFARAESRSLLAAYVPKLPQTEADRLAEALGDLPLALAQAGGLIATSGFSVDTYLKDLTATSRLLDRSAPITYQHKTLGAAVRLSSAHLARTDPVASELLRICAFLAPEPIPLDNWITKEGAQLPPSLDCLVGDPVAVADATAAMARLGLVRPQPDGLTIHRLTAAVLRDRTGANATAAHESAHEHAKNLVISVRPDDEGRDPATWHEWASLLPHVMTLSETWTHDDNMRQLSLDATQYLLMRGTTSAAYDAARALHQRWSADFSPDHPHLLTAETYLADILNILGQYRQALAVIENVVELSRNALGDDHEKTLAANTALATTLTDLGQFHEARAIEEDVLRRRRSALGQDHRDTLASGNNLAVTLDALGDHHSARALKEDVLERLHRTLGRNHPDTLTTATNLALTMGDLGEHVQARALLEDIVDRSRKTLGDDHPNTLNTASGLAAALNTLGHHHKAQTLREDVLSRRRRVLGEDHPRTLSSYRDLATTLTYLGHHARARSILHDVLSRSRTMLGDTHPDTLTFAHNLAAVLTRINQHVQARALLQSTLDQRRAALGQEHPTTLTTAASLASVLSHLGRRKEARVLLQNSLAGFRRTLGEEHPKTKAVAEQLASYKKVFGKRKKKIRRP
ncbi:FxSxx-COOH system tetratricopeptide repeat protein [Streptomyces violaceusniger]|uniref:FxSxx-COOH system tetratricopeptide repeat protein n=1 Tax=Streptomyces violaceusniger TaxID=68280 RepID=UPI00342C7370